MAKREVKSWITINGVHVPIFEGQTKEEAAKAAIERQKKRGPVSSDTRKKSEDNYKPENTFENRKKLKDQIDAYVKAHPNPNAEDRNKVSAMRDRYNAMVKESAAKTKAKVNAELAEERKRDAQKKELEDLKREHYKLYKHDEDNIPDRDEKLNALEKKISELENGSDSDKKQRVSIYKNQLKDVQDDIKQFEDTPSRLRSADYDQKLEGLKKKESDLQGYIDRDTKPAKSSAPEFKSRQEAEEYYKNKFAGVSSTYANKMAKKMGIEGRGKDKREALAKAYADRWETSHNISNNEAEKEKQIARNETERKQAEQSSETQPKLSEKTQRAVKNALADRVWTKARGSEEEQSEIAVDNWRYAGISNEKMVKLMNEVDPEYEYRIEKYSDKKGGRTYNHQILCREPKEGGDVTVTPPSKKSGVTKVGETSGGTFNVKELNEKIARERAEKAAKEKALSDEANRIFKPASDDVKRMAQAETLKSMGINRDAAINEIRNRTGLSLEDAERKLGSMSADQIKKMLGKQNKSNGVFGDILYRGHNRELVAAVSKDLGISMDEAAKKMDTMHPQTIKKYIRMTNRQKK